MTPIEGAGERIRDRLLHERSTLFPQRAEDERHNPERDSDDVITAMQYLQDVLLPRQERSGNSRQNVRASLTYKVRPFMPNGD
jgi:hypothetical protein